MRGAWYPHGGDRGKRLSMGISVGEVPSGASALPNQRGVIKTVGPHRWEA